MKRAWVIGIAALLVASGCGGSAAGDPGPTPGPSGPSASPEASSGASRAGDGGTAGAIAAPIGEVPADAPPWLRGEDPLDLSSRDHVFAVGVGADLEHARVAARARLEEVLWGEVARRPEGDALPGFSAEHDIERSETLADGRVAVLLAVPRSSYALRLETWLQQAPSAATTDASTPQGMLHAALAFLRYQLRQRFGCERQRAMVDSACEPADTTVAEKQVAEVGARIQLEPTHEDGIPVRTGHGVLAPASVRARWRNAAGMWVPWPNLPLRLVAAPGVVRAPEVRTDATGLAEIPLERVPTSDEAPITVSVAAEALLGTHAGLWSLPALELRAREVSAAKGGVAIYLRELVLDEPTKATASAQACVQRLRERGRARVVVLTREQGEALLRAYEGERNRLLRELAKESRGAIDVVVLGDARSEFESRMSADSLWHAAHAQATAFDVWTGRALGEVKQQARGRGLGDESAGKRALEQVGGLLGEALQALLGAGGST